jgi:hypothetical protein
MLWIAAIHSSPMIAGAHGRQRVRAVYGIIEMIRQADPAITYRGLADELTRRQVETLRGAQWSINGVNKVLRRMRALGDSVASENPERALVPLVAELRLAGIETPTAMACELNARGITTEAGCDWYCGTVKRLFKASDELVRSARLAEAPRHILGRRSSRRGAAATAAAIQAHKRHAAARANLLLPVIIEAHHAGAIALRPIAKRANEQGKGAPRGGHCYAMTIKRVLDRRGETRLVKHGGLAPMAAAEQKAVRQARIRQYDERLKRRLDWLVDRGYSSTGALVPELNRRGWLSFWGRPWNVGLLGAHLRDHFPALLDMIQTYRGPARRALIEAAYQRADREGITDRAARVAAFNLWGVPTLSGRGAGCWNKSVMYYADRGVGRVPIRRRGVSVTLNRRGRSGNTPKQNAVIEHNKRLVKAVIGIKRRGGRPSGREILAQLAAKGLSSGFDGRPLTVQKIYAVCYARGIRLGRRRLWSEEDVTEMVALKGQGKTVGWIAGFFRASRRTVAREIALAEQRPPAAG